MPNYLGFDIGVAVGSFYDADGFLDVQPDAYGEQSSGVAPYELHAPHGFFSRPLDPDTDASGNPGRGCQMLTALEGGKGHAWLCSDPRVLERLPQLPKGSSGTYGGPLGKDPSTAIFSGTDGSYTITVGYAQGPDGKPTQSHTIKVDPTGATIAITHGGGATVTLSTTGVAVNGTAVTIGQAATAQPVALGPAVVQALNALSSGLVQVGAAAGLALLAQGAIPASIAAAGQANAAIAKILATNTSAS